MRKRKNICEALLEDLYLVLPYNDFIEDDQEGSKSSDSEKEQTEKPGKVRAFFSKVKEKVTSIAKKVLSFFKRNGKVIVGVSLFILSNIASFAAVRKRLIDLGIASRSDSILTVLSKLDVYTRFVSAGVRPEALARNFDRYARDLDYYSFIKYPGFESLSKSHYRSSRGYKLALLENKKDEDVFFHILELSFHDALRDSIIKSMSHSKDKTFRLLGSIFLEALDKNPKEISKLFLAAYKQYSKEFTELYKSL